MKIELTEREKEVVHELSRGLANQEVADRLKISINTVKTHLSRSCKKTASKNRTDLVIKYLKNEI